LSGGSERELAFHSEGDGKSLEGPKWGDYGCFYLTLAAVWRMDCRGQE
jgi:hypothetical protein